MEAYLLIPLLVGLVIAALAWIWLIVCAIRAETSGGAWAA